MLYTAEQRKRRDRSPWTTVQGVLAPLQFAVMVVSAVLAVQFLRTGEGYALATASVVVKTLLLYLIMVTGSLWEKDVFGQHLFAPLFFWEDVVSMGVMVLHTAYIAALLLGLLTEAQLMWLALAAYAAYTVNAIQFVLKLRAARKDAAGPRSPERPSSGRPGLEARGRLARARASLKGGDA